MKVPQGYARVTRGFVERGDLILEVSGRWAPAVEAVGDAIREYRVARKNSRPLRSHGGFGSSRAPRGYRRLRDPDAVVRHGDLVRLEQMGDFTEWGPARVYIGRKVKHLLDYIICRPTSPRRAGAAR